jgi:hypothetical protein
VFSAVCARSLFDEGALSSGLLLAFCAMVMGTQCGRWKQHYALYTDLCMADCMMIRFKSKETCICCLTCVHAVDSDAMMFPAAMLTLLARA